MFYHISLFLLLILTAILYIRIAKRFNIVDKPNARSSHANVTIRGGGILFYVAILFFFVYSGLEYPYFFWATTLIAVVSFVDDLNPLPPSVRFPVQILAVALLLYEIGFELPMLVVLLLLIMGVAFVNAYNFMDGINGITVTNGIVILCGFWYVNTLYPFINPALLTFGLLALVVFGFFNFRKKAVFFSGDIGSIVLAMLLLYVAFLCYAGTGSPLVLLFFAVYGIDTFLTIVQRFLLKEKLSVAHRRHLYQVIVDKKLMNHLETSTSYAVVQLVFILIALPALRLTIAWQWGLTLAQLFLGGLVYFLIKRKLLRTNESIQNP